ncbi:MAG: 2,3-bisphosphoglycerate-independent phosphoglycerate mutase [Deltaproteobacteria bacterium]|nr:2,3-bisphosphoglycerate-independent phosphoglycerate mutase [Deltaproteobacteria bacterium]
MKFSSLLLIVFDGLGINPRKEGNAFALARTPTFDRLRKNFPYTQLLAHGEHVGLPQNQIGNSEVGHMNMGAGRIVYQDLTRIDKYIEAGTFFNNEILKKTIQSVKQKKAKLHLLGLVSEGGVHSHLRHLFALLKMAKQENFSDIHIHCFLDGRDTPPQSSVLYLSKLQEKIKELGIGSLSSLCGRFYAMDRDNRWERTQKAYELLTQGEGLQEQSYEKAIQKSYDEETFDEFVKPVLLDPEGLVQDNDAVIFFNFRPDRARQLTRVFTEENFSQFQKKKSPKLSGYVCFTLYDKNFDLPVAFPPLQVSHILSEVLSRNHLPQFRCAETEKYAHITYFFNCRIEKPFELEERCLVDSPRDVRTYDLKPEMSARKVTERVIEALNANKHQLYIINFANPDMVGHTGNMAAAIKAVEVSDECLGKILKPLFEKNGSALITADHGNVEQMIYYETGKPHTAHTTNPVPLYLASHKLKNVKLREGILSNISPTVLSLLHLEKPKEMDQESLIIQ